METRRIRLLATTLAVCLAIHTLVAAQQPATETPLDAPQAETDQVPTDLVADPLQAAVAAVDAPSIVRLIEIPLPIQGTVDTTVRASIERILENVSATTTRPIIVLEFVPPDDGIGETSEFGRALDLARYLISQRTSQARIVAYLPQTVRGHAVLVALACEQIIMHPDAKLGAAGVAEPLIDETVRRGYSEIAGRRLTIPAAVAVGLVDPEAQVSRVTTASGTQYALSSELAEIQSSANVLKIDTIIPAGEAGLLSGDKLRLEFGFVSHLAEDRSALAAALGVSTADLQVDPIVDGNWRAIRLDLNGPINTSHIDQAMRSLEDELRQEREDPLFVCIAIDSPGGSVKESLRFAKYLAGLDSNRVRTVAYVPREARSDAAWIALACDQLAVKSEAVIGGGGAGTFSRNDVEAASQSLQAILTQKDRSWSLPVAMLDAELSVHRYQLVGTNSFAYFCQQELAEQAEPDRWQRREEVSPSGELFETTGAEAVERHLARHEVADFPAFLQAYQLPEAPAVLKPNWAQEFVVALANPRVAAGLLMIGFFALIIEAHTPGLGIGGFVAAVCFLLFFWSNFLQGTAGWLEVLLFVSGFVFIGLEIFVIPGFGIFGLGGAIMVLLSLVLASQTFVIPRNAYQMEQLPRSLLIVAAALGGVGVSAVALNRYLGESALLKRFVLLPAEGEMRAERERRESIVHYDHLLGKQGRSTTRLTPSGKAKIEDDYYDVVSDGLMVSQSALIEVIEVTGNKIVVREVETP